MKIVVTADIHYGVGNNQHLVRKLAKKIIKTKADVLLLVGDTFAFNQRLLQECLRLFNGFTGDKLFVAGNHDLWTRGTDSLKVYEKTLLWITKQCGFHYLDQKPFTKGKVGFVGIIGWYDYSFKDKSKPIPPHYYLSKQWPGVVSWNDGHYVHLGMSDSAFTERVNRKLKRHLVLASKKVSTIICAVHHVPFRQLLRTNYTSTDKFLTAFSGSEETGKIIRSFPNVTYVFCGHTHQKKRAIINGITAINIGSDYLRKRFDVIDL
jgi:predicted phosphohydrolase